MSIRLPELACAGCVLAVVGVSLAIPSCRTEPQITDPIPVSPEGLFSSFRNTPSTAETAWLGRVLRVRLRARDYRVSGRTLMWHDSNPDAPPAIIFDTDRILPDSNSNLEIVGTCQGRPGRETGHIHVTGCQVSVMP